MSVRIEWQNMIKRCRCAKKGLHNRGAIKIQFGEIETLLEDIKAANQVLLSDLSPGFEFYEKSANILQLSENDDAYVIMEYGEMEFIESFITLMLADKEYYTYGNNEVRIEIFNAFLKLLVKDTVRLNRVASKLMDKYITFLPKPNEITMNILFMGFGYIVHDDIKEGYFNLYLGIISLYELKHDSHLVMKMFGALRHMIINDKSQSLFDHLTNNFIPDKIDLPLYNRIICTYHKLYFNCSSIMETFIYTSASFYHILPFYPHRHI